MSAFANLRDHVLMSSAKKATRKRADVVLARFATEFRRSLGPRLLTAFQAPACKDVADRYALATTDFVRAMDECDGSPESIIAVNRLSNAYLQSVVDAMRKAKEVADAS